MILVRPLLPKKSMNILVIDDNQTAAWALGKLLEFQGYHVQIAHDGAAGLEMADESSPDAIILDIDMPGKDGYEVARVLRTKPTFGALLIALTGHETDVSIHEDERVRFARFDYRFTKPISVSEMERVLNLPRFRAELV
jgi:CheY-like chemotaxis protein